MKSDQPSESRPSDHEAPAVGHHDCVTTMAPDRGMQEGEVRHCTSTARGRFFVPDVVLRFEDDPSERFRNNLPPRAYDFTWTQACINHPAEARLLLDHMAIILDEHEALQPNR